MVVFTLHTIQASVVSIGQDPGQGSGPWQTECTPAPLFLIHYGCFYRV